MGCEMSGKIAVCSRPVHGAVLRPRPGAGSCKQKLGQRGKGAPAPRAAALAQQRLKSTGILQLAAIVFARRAERLWPWPPQAPAGTKKKQAGEHPATKPNASCTVCRFSGLRQPRRALRRYVVNGHRHLLSEDAPLSREPGSSTAVMRRSLAMSRSFRLGRPDIRYSTSPIQHRFVCLDVGHITKVQSQCP